jgi:uroporphyrinogen-III synthase
VADHPRSPLAGKRVVITRAESQSATLAAALRAKGAEVVLLPLIQIVSPKDFTPLDSALSRLASFDWLIFTSQNAVAAVAGRLAALEDRKETPAAPLSGRARNRNPTAGGSLRIAAVGNSTAGAARAAGFSVTHTGKGSAADLIAELRNDLRGKRVFLPRSDRAAPALCIQLRAAGAEVIDATAYRTPALEYTDKPFDDDSGDAILFFSPSAVSGFLNAEKSGIVSARKYAAFGAIGPVTGAALLENGLPCDFQARESSVQHIVAAVVEHLQKKNKSRVMQGNSR